MLYNTGAVKLFHFGHFLDSYVEVLDDICSPFVLGDRDSVLRHFLPLIKAEAAKYHRLYRCDLDDLVSLGILGLYEAVAERSTLETVSEVDIIRFVKSRIKRSIFREFDKKHPIFLDKLEKEDKPTFYLDEVVEELSLTPLESAVLKWLLEGYSQREICNRSNYDKSKLNRIIQDIRGKYNAYTSAASVV